MNYSNKSIQKSNETLTNNSPKSIIKKSNRNNQVKRVRFAEMEIDNGAGNWKSAGNSRKASKVQNPTKPKSILKKPKSIDHVKRVTFSDAIMVECEATGMSISLINDRKGYVDSRVDTVMDDAMDTETDVVMVDGASTRASTLRIEQQDKEGEQKKGAGKSKKTNKIRKEKRKGKIAKDIKGDHTSCIMKITGTGKFFSKRRPCTNHKPSAKLEKSATRTSDGHSLNVRSLAKSLREILKSRPSWKKSQVKRSACQSTALSCARLGGLQQTNRTTPSVEPKYGFPSKIGRVSPLSALSQINKKRKSASIRLSAVNKSKISAFSNWKGNGFETKKNLLLHPSKAESARRRSWRVLVPEDVLCKMKKSSSNVKVLDGRGTSKKSSESSPLALSTAYGSAFARNGWGVSPKSNRDSLPGSDLSKSIDDDDGSTKKNIESRCEFGKQVWQGIKGCLPSFFRTSDKTHPTKGTRKRGRAQGTARGFRGFSIWGRGRGW